MLRMREPLRWVQQIGSLATSSVEQLHYHRLAISPWDSLLRLYWNLVSFLCLHFVWKVHMSGRLESHSGRNKDIPNQRYRRARRVRRARRANERAMWISKRQIIMKWNCVLYTQRKKCLMDSVFIYIIYIFPGFSIMPGCTEFNIHLLSWLCDWNRISCF